MTGESVLNIGLNLKILHNKRYFLVFYKPKKRNNILDVIFIIFKWERLAIETIDKYTSVPFCNAYFKFSS